MKASQLYELAQMRLMCQYEDKNAEKEGLDLYRQAARRGHFLSKWELAEHLHLWGETKKEMAEALYWYENIAEKHGYPFAQYHAGYMYYVGEGTRKNKEKALFWLEKAALKGVGEALVLYCRHLCFVSKSKKDCKKGFEMLLNAEQKNVRESHIVYLYEDDTPEDFYSLLAACYLKGAGTEIDYAKAAEYYQKSADEGGEYACLQLGKLYAEGKGVEKDPAQAFENYKIAAYFFAEAQYLMGMCYLEGFGTEQNDKLAFKYLKEAEQNGCGEAAYQLGICYLEGVGTRKNRPKGIEWLKKAERKYRNAEAYLKLHELFPDEYP